MIFKFLGGPLDGQTVVEQPGDPSRPLRYYALTHHGRVGQRFRTASEYAIETLAREELKTDEPHRFQPHYYEVFDRVENKGVLLVRARYVQERVAE
jgi:hypothetical protein